MIGFAMIMMMIIIILVILGFISPRQLHLRFF
jgi:hypothetical protein